jgi:hypothetical protein
MRVGELLTLAVFKFECVGAWRRRAKSAVKVEERQPKSIRAAKKE